MCTPTGIGFLYGKLDLLKEMPPFFGGGEMIADVLLEHSKFINGKTKSARNPKSQNQNIIW